MTAPDAPWSVAWSGEQAFRLQPSQDFPGMMELDQKQAPGVGEPLFAAVHVTRQRRGMVDLLCHVCGKPTTRHDRYMFPAASGGLVTLQDGTQQYGCNVPPMHRACTTRALRDCPHLAKVRERPLRCSGDEGRLIHRTDVTPGLEALARTLPRDVDIVFSCYRLYGPEFTRRVTAARDDWDRTVRSRRAPSI
ncbi:hypothetical protein [Phenylobacterium sp.]|jgi:hypothetical protein|uniref:hypothetical protein n=1 Tax=Phenylobacterium sp. TaxID=1871053 RepID=UPI002F412177